MANSEKSVAKQLNQRISMMSTSKVAPLELISKSRVRLPSISQQSLTSQGSAISPPLRKRISIVDDETIANIIAATHEIDLNKVIFKGKLNSSPIMEVKVAPKRQFMAKQSEKLVEIWWKDLTYTVKTGSNYLYQYRKTKPKVENQFTKIKSDSNKRVILKGLSGSFRSGEMTAVMGPSGAGKSTLLECVCGKRRRGVGGQIRIAGTDTVQIGYVEQFDFLLQQLTVKESLVFASRLRNANRNLDHSLKAESLIAKLGLQICADTRVLSCSGGQKKRLSIALELVCRVNVLILDEPTSGLDSSACAQTVEAMLSLTKKKKPIAVVATIHQPNTNLFNLFHNIYVLSEDGNCIFQGSPSEVIPTLSLVGLQCPTFYNPADFLIEVASGEFGKQSIYLLTHYNKEFNRTKFSIAMNDNDLSLVEAMRQNKLKASKPILKHMSTLIERTFISTIREPQLSIIRIITTLILAMAVCLLYGNKVGKASGCPPSRLMLWTLDVNNLVDKFEDERYVLQENLSLMFISLMMGIFTTMSPILLSFPTEMNVFRKEHQNSYYGVFAYYIAKQLADIPILALTSVSFTTILWTMTGQINDSYWRICYFILINLLNSFIGQAFGLCFGALFMESPASANYVSGMALMPLVFFSGFFRKLSLLPSYLYPMSYVSFYRYSLSAMLITVYGAGRCPYEHYLAESQVAVKNLTRPKWLRTMSVIFEYQSFLYENEEVEEREPEANIMLMFGGKDSASIDSQKSLLLSQMAIEDTNSSLYFEIYMLFVMIVVLHFFIYIIMYKKVHRKQ